MQAHFGALNSLILGLVSTEKLVCGEKSEVSEVHIGQYLILAKSPSFIRECSSISSF